MRRLRRVSTVVIAALAIASCAATRVPASEAVLEAPASCATISTGGPDAEEIRRLEHIGAQSNVEGWSIEEARTFFAPDWISIGPNGNTTGLDTVLSGFENGRSRPWAGRFEVLDLEIRVYCDVAVVIGRAAAYPIGAADTERAPAAHFRWLNVWRKEGGRWVYAANQFTRY